MSLMQLAQLATAAEAQTISATPSRSATPPSPASEIDEKPATKRVLHSPLPGVRALFPTRASFVHLDCRVPGNPDVPCPFSAPRALSLSAHFNILKCDVRFIKTTLHPDRTPRHQYQRRHRHRPLTRQRWPPPRFSYLERTGIWPNSVLASPHAGPTAPASQSQFAAHSPGLTQVSTFACNLYGATFPSQGRVWIRPGIPSVLVLAPPVQLCYP